MLDHKQNLEFRFAHLKDALEITRLVNSAYRGESSLTGWTTEAELLAGQRTDEAAVIEMIQTPGQWFLMAENQKKLVAVAHLEQVSSELCFFGMFAVVPEKQGSGIGKAFMQEAERHARTRWSCQVMEMSVITLRRDLIAFYERRGYQFTGEIRPFFYGNERYGIPLREDLQLGIWRKRL